MDHRFLNYEVPPFDKIVPTAENVAAEIWNRLAARLHGTRRSTCTTSGCTKPKTCTWITRESGHDASHPPLSIRGFASAAFRAILGRARIASCTANAITRTAMGTTTCWKCVFLGRSIRVSGQVVNVPALDRLVAEQVLQDFDHRYLNADVREFQELVPTSENILRVIEDRLAARWRSVFPGEWPRLEAHPAAGDQAQSIRIEGELRDEEKQSSCENDATEAGRGVHCIADEKAVVEDRRRSGARRPGAHAGARREGAALSDQRL